MSGTAPRPVTRSDNHRASVLAKLACPLLETGELMRIPRALALFMLAFLAVPSAVAGQTAPPQGDISAFVASVTIDGEPITNLTNETIVERGFNIVECAAKDTVETTIRLGSLPPGITFVDAWLGDSSQDCSTTAARQTGTNRVCVHLDEDPTIDGGEITINLADMLDPDDDACEGTVATGETLRLWLFAKNSTETTAEVTRSEYVYVTFRVDTSAPGTPTPDSTSVRGDQSVPIEWEGATDQGPLSFNVYLDTSVGSCADAGEWAPGEPPPSVDPVTGGASGTRASVNTSSLAVGQSALAYITAVDKAENESNLSTAVCVTRVETVGFCDALEDAGTPCTNSCAATVPVSRGAAQALWLGLLGLALLVRRRTR